VTRPAQDPDSLRRQADFRRRQEALARLIFKTDRPSVVEHVVREGGYTNAWPNRTIGADDGDTEEGARTRNTG
jgi:hypothetical protein